MEHRNQELQWTADPERGRDGFGLKVGILLSLPYWLAVAVIISLW
jgi:hypothetical protein